MQFKTNTSRTCIDHSITQLAHEILDASRRIADFTQNAETSFKELQSWRQQAANMMKTYRELKDRLRDEAKQLDKARVSVLRTTAVFGRRLIAHNRKSNERNRNA